MSNIKTKTFPTTPGVYLMKDKKGLVIYVGKAKNLRARVRQYFSNNDTRYQIQFLMKRVQDIDFIETPSEAEALLLENSLIKKHKPKYNVFLKDDKSYPCLKITIKDEYPKLIKTRRIQRDGALYFGPFTNAGSLHVIKEFIDQYFLLRTCSDRELMNRTRPCLEYQIKRCSAPCVKKVSKKDYQDQMNKVVLFLNGKNKELKKEVKVSMESAAKKENFEEAARFRDLLEGLDLVLQGQNVTRLSFDFVDVITFKRIEDRICLAVLMVREAKLIDSRYYIFDSLEEDTEFLQNFLVQYYTETSFIPKGIFLSKNTRNIKLVEEILKERAGYRVKISVPQKGDKKTLIKMAEQNLTSHFTRDRDRKTEKSKILKEIKEKCHLSKIPKSIECYDVSNISGQHAVASLVQFVNGEANNDGYRRFKIKGQEEPNDYAMLKEVFERRFKKSEGKWALPDLIMVDGGKGQLSQVLAVLEELGVEDLDVLAIAKGQGVGVRALGDWDAKKEEEIYIPGRKNPIKFKKGSKELQLLQIIRDEAHRFAITYHRCLREKALTKSWLDDVPGIGKALKAKLIKKFGSPENVRKASVEDLKTVSGVTEAKARMIKAFKP